ncbi:MAG: hypothetical protein IKL84_05630, partial [Clostridia bacterium]|nr:hypothetical protein [Clostridia bacterium]
MYDETVATLDAFLNSIGEYEAVDYLINQKMQYVSQGGENAVAAFKQSMKEMATYIMGPAHAPTQLFKSSIQLKIKTSTCNYTVTADSTYPYNINNTVAFLLKIQCERIRNDTLVTP